MSGLFGVPTHKNFDLQHASFGYGQVGTGVQIDGSYAFNTICSLIYGGRYIYFVPRKTYDSLGNKYTFSIGNIGDILLACKNNFDVHHGLEGGYTFRAQFGASISPFLEGAAQKTNYLRSNFYLVYKYKFLINEVSNRLLFYFSYGFDHKPKTSGCKYILTFWTSWNISF